MKGFVTSDRLTPRELEVLRLTALGYRNPEVATKLSVEAQTIKNHKHSIFLKLEARTSAHAVSIAKDKGLI